MIKTAGRDWAVLTVKDNRIVYFDDKFEDYFGIPSIGSTPLASLRWFRNKWLSDGESIFLKTSPEDLFLMEVMEQNDGSINFYFKRVTEFRSTQHLWCEPEEQVIRLQRFIDTSHDGIIVSDKDGIVRAVNDSFYKIMDDDTPVIGKSIYSLQTVQSQPYNTLAKAMVSKKTENAYFKLANGREISLTCSPLLDYPGGIIRLLANIRNETELQEIKKQILESDVPMFPLEKDIKPKEDNLIHICKSNAMVKLREQLTNIADFDVTVMLRGESGVGKTTLAKYIHSVSNRNNSGSFVHISCTSIPESLLESELFGYEAGAFTGANKLKVGLFEMADKGTVFLDEIGDMPIQLQAKLLNVLQEKSFYRVGGTKPITTDVRIIAATNADIDKLAEEGKFRQDLLYRLNVIPLEIPRLADRPEDIELIANHFLQKFNNKYGTGKYFSKSAMSYLTGYSWPGNIRELMNTVERMVVLVKGDELGYLDIRPLTAEGEAKLPENTLWVPGQSLKQAVSSVESHIIDSAVDFCGSVKLAAKMLKIDESTLRRKKNKRH